MIDSMNIFIVLALAMGIILVLLKKKVPIGPAILTGGLFIWAVKAPEVHYLVSAARETVTMRRTFDLIAALYLVMCLEIELRTSGCLDGMVKALHRIFSSARVTLAIMPAFLGMLPSLGGARFSAPIVETAAKEANIDAEHKAAINFWFRHIFEFSNPIIPGMIMAVSIAGVKYSDFIIHLGWMTVMAFACGWFVLIRPIKVDRDIAGEAQSETEKHRYNVDLMLSLAPVIVNFGLAVFCGFDASAAMLAVVIGLLPVLYMTGRRVNVKNVFLGACDWKMLINVATILYFIQILTTTHVLDEIVYAFRTSPLPVPVIIAGVTFVIGVLTGMSQGHVAIIMPIVAALEPGSLNLAGIAMAFGIAGQMLTPTHMCLLVTIDYFKSDFFKTLKPILILEIMILSVFTVYTYFTY